MRGPGRKATAIIVIASASQNEIIAAPTTGHIEIDHITFIADGGTNTITFEFATTDFFGPTAFDDNQAYVFDNASGDYPWVGAEAVAFNIVASSSNACHGFVQYRVVGEA